MVVRITTNLRAVRGYAGGVSPHTNPSGPPRSLEQAEAVARAALLDVTAYDVSLDLDRGAETFGSVTTIDLVSQGGPTFLDVQPVSLASVTVNGTAVDVGLLDRGRLPITTDPGENRIVVDAVMRFRNDGEGLHRAVDPADGQHYVYAMTFLDAAPSIFGCFDQPDLKAVWTLHVRAPRDWTVIGNSPATEVEPGQWDLATTLPLSTYLVALVAGPYHVVRSEHDGIPLGISARASMARHLDHDAEELFTVTGQSFDELHRLFGMRYPFGEYHQAFVPEFNAGAMESAACVTFRDEYIFESRAVRSQHIFRANVIAHEMAHMWFGDIVTPVWWDDLWLNESFAEYMGARVTASATEFTDAWLHDAYSRHQWGLTADQRPTTHPIAGNGARDASVALQNFDGISYAKGAVVIKQLNRTLGDDVFFAGVSDHFERHQYANATMADLVESWERAAGADLSAFRDGWLLTAGPDRLELDRTAGVVRRTPLPEHPASREHTLTIASAPADAPGSWTLDTLVVDADEVPVAVTDGPMVIDPHFETWAVTLVDPSSLPSLAAALPATEDPLLRASVWNSVRNAFYHAQLDPADVLDLLEAAMPDEDTDDGIGFTLAWATGTVVPLATDPMAALARMRDVAARRATTAPPGSTLQLAAFRSQVAASREADDLRRWLAGTGPARRGRARPRAALAHPLPPGHHRRRGPRRARRRARRRADVGLPRVPRALAGRHPRRRGQGLGVGALHRRGRRAQPRARGHRHRPVAARPGGPDRRLRRPLLRRPARDRRGAQHPDARLGGQPVLPGAGDLGGDRGPRERPARAARPALDAAPRGRRPDLRPGAPRGRQAEVPVIGRARRPGPTVRTRVREFGDGTERAREDRLATEEPLEIRLTWPGTPAQRVWVTMRTPGHDFELAAGFCCHEGMAAPSSPGPTIGGIAYCTDVDLTPEQELNVVTVTLTGPTDIGHRHTGLSAGSSACGVCGKDSVTEVLDSVRGVRTAWTGPLPHPDVVRRLPDPPA